MLLFGNNAQVVNASALLDCKVAPAELERLLSPLDAMAHISKDVLVSNYARPSAKLIGSKHYTFLLGSGQHGMTMGCTFSHKNNFHSVCALQVLFFLNFRPAMHDQGLHTF